MSRHLLDETQAGRGLGRVVAGALLLGALVFGVGAPVWAYWTSAGAGAGAATTATLEPPAAPVLTHTAGTESVAVSWSAPAGLVPDGYYVTRVPDSGPAEQACGTSPEVLVQGPCTDAPVPAGTYLYTVTAVYRSWTATSGASATVTVGTDVTAPVVAVTTVNGAPRVFPYLTNAAVTSIGGTCGNTPGDLPTVSPLVGGLPTTPATATCAGGTWTLTPATPLTMDGTWSLSATQSDAAGNTGIAPAQTVVLDTTAPAVTSIVRAGGSAAVNALPVSWTVTFSEPVVAVAASNFALVRSGIGGPAPSLALSPTGGSPSATWTVTADGSGVTGIDAGSIRLDLAGVGSITDPATNPLITSSFVGEAYTYDTTRPTVTEVSSTTLNGSYRAGEVIPVTITFSEPVVVTGTPTLALATGVPAGTAVPYTSGSGTTMLTFEYTVASGHSSPDLDYVAATSLALAGGAIADAAGNDTTRTLAAPGTSGSLGFVKDLVIDTTAPVVAVTRVNNTVRTFPFSTTANVTSVGGTCGTAAGDVPTVTVLVDGTSAGSAPCNSGSWTLATSWTTEGTRIVSVTQADAAGNVGTTPEASVSVDRTRPTLLSIDRAGPVAVNTGPLVWTVTFSEPVSSVAASNFTVARSGVTGTTTITGVAAPGGPPSATWTVTVNTSGVTGTNSGSIGLNLRRRGSVVDAAGNSLLTNSFTGQAYTYDTTVPTVTGVSSPLPNGRYRAGQVIPVEVTFSEPVSVTGTPQIGLATGSPAVTAVDCTSGSGSTTLTFEYTVAAGHTSADLDYATTTSLALNGGVIADAATNAATLTLPAPGATGSLGASKNLVVDTTAPTVVGVSSPLGNGSYRAGQAIPVTVTFSEPVTVGGTPRLDLATGTPPATGVDYTSGSGSSALTFTYTVAAGNTSADLDYVDATALALDGGSIGDAAGNAAVLTLPNPGAAGSLGASKDLVIDTTAPVLAVTRVNGSVRTFPYTTNANVTSIGGTCGTGPGDSGTVAPRINGAATTPATANCMAGSWTLTLGTALSTSGSRTISASQGDAAGNTGTAPDQTVVIDKVAPTVSSIVRAGVDPVVNAGPLTWTVTFSEPVSGVAVSDFGVASSGITGTPTVSGVSAFGAPPSATWEVSVGVPGVTGTNAGSIRLDLTGSGSVVDAVGNALATSSFPGQAYGFDTTAPAVAAVSAGLADGTYGAGQVIPVTVTFSEPVVVTGTPTIALATGTPASTDVAYSSGSGSDTLVFEYTVAAGHTSADLDYVAPTSLVLGGGAITDLATNAAALTLPGPGATGSLGGSKDLVIDTTAPEVTVTQIEGLNFWIFRLLRVAGTAEAGAGPVTVYLCTSAACDAGSATQTFTNVAVAANGTWQTGWSAQGQGTWYARATQADAVGNVGTSETFGPYTN